MLTKDDIGRRLRQLLRQRDMTQTDLARDTGIDRSHINRYVNGRRMPTVPQLERIARALSVGLEAVT